MSGRRLGARGTTTLGVVGLASAVAVEALAATEAAPAVGIMEVGAEVRMGTAAVVAVPGGAAAAAEDEGSVSEGEVNP